MKGLSKMNKAVDRMASRLLAEKEALKEELQREHALVARLEEENKKLREVLIDLAPWASAAQEDSNVCQELKDIFYRVIEAAPQEIIPHNGD